MISGNRYDYLLERFSIDEREIIVKYFEQIQYNKDERITDRVAVAISFIVTKIIRNETKLVKDNVDLLLFMVDVKKITDKLIDLFENFIPISEKYFTYLDSHAEFMLLFCNNYTYGLIDKVENSDIRLIRQLKLKKLSEK